MPREEKSFWRSWFGFGSIFDLDHDADDDTKRNSNKINVVNPNSNRHDGTRLSTRKSSAERATNFNCPSEEEKIEIQAWKKTRSEHRLIR